MRITDKVMVSGYLSDLTNNLENKQKIMDQMSSGKEISKPSDDPFKVARSMELLSDISVNERYSTNIDEGTGWLNSMESSMGQMNDALQSIREKTISGGNGAYGADEKNAIADYIKQLKEELVNLGNSSYDGRYIFGGDKTTDKAFIKDASGNVAYNGSNNGLIKEFAQGVKIDIGASKTNFGDNFMKIVGPNGVLDKIIGELSSNGDPNKYLDDLDSSMDSIMRVRSETGAKWQRLTDMKSKNDEENYNMTDLLSKTMDVDISKKYMEYSVMDSVYTASLKAGAKLLEPSILDFIR